MQHPAGVPALRVPDPVVRPLARHQRFDRHSRVGRADADAERRRRWPFPNSSRRCAASPTTASSPRRQPIFWRQPKPRAPPSTIGRGPTCARCAGRMPTPQPCRITSWWLNPRRHRRPRWHGVRRAPRAISSCWRRTCAKSSPSSATSVAARARRWLSRPTTRCSTSSIPGLRRKRIDPLFDKLRTELPGLIGEAQERQRGDTFAPVAGSYPATAQRVLGETLMRTVGFDFDRGRLDTSLHPFCGGATGDVRITTRYTEGDFSRALMGVLHETGHAMYEQGRPAQWLQQPVGDARGMVMHESQSLLIEMQACRTAEFPRLSIAAAAGGLRPRRCGPRGGQPAPALYARAAGLHPG